MALAQITSARQEVQTPDEGVHLVSGYSILRQGRFSLNAENPPVGKVLSAVPLLWLNPDLPREATDSWQEENTVAISVPFLYRNRLPADRILFWGRVPAMLIALAFGVALATWTQYRFGWTAALVALALFCFDPNIIAHSRYVTSDIYAAFFYFLAAIAWGEYLVRRRPVLLAAAAVLSGAGVCAKFNLLILPVLFLAMSLWYSRFRQKSCAGRILRDFSVYLLIMGIAVWAIYGFETRTIASDRPAARFLSLDSAALHTSHVLPAPAILLLDPDTHTGTAIHWIAAHVPIPAYSFFKGIYRLFNHFYWGHRSYLLGNVSEHGWWYYFPIAFLVKTPTGTILLLILTLSAWGRMKTGEYPLGLLLIPPIFYFAVSMNGSINIGLRHILPVYAFSFVCIGIAVSQVRGVRRVMATAALLLVICESVLIYPHYLAFFNTLAGGSRNGPKYLLDSNIDWGQDALKLKRYMAEQHLTSIPLQYFGSANLSYYGISSQPLDDAIRSGKRCRAALSVTEWQSHPQFLWLKNCDPLARVGYSIYVYDLNSPECHATLSSKLIQRGSE